eukprot:TRINITY_DN24862_c0_g1_i1.p1 TRINITY_DN24862_c0_g1~~TRINITY_DN24862_c0_g1_i1.p1  ORF type:complete len:327 (+),score=62.64 TRINITY_DN24862_c0_g1_i1:71-1051(+)
MATEDDAAECAVCLEAVEESTELPCSCKIPYCFRCWDRCLAESFRNQGQATCPTCRTPVRVDFEADKGKLVFSKAAALEVTKPTHGPPPSDASPVEQRAHLQRMYEQDMAYQECLRQSYMEDVERIARQAIPAQEKILQAYGDANAALRSVLDKAEEVLQKKSVKELKALVDRVGGTADGCVEKEDIVKRLREAASSDANLVSVWAQETCELGPKCICGDSLTYVSGKGRALKMLSQQTGVPEDDPRLLEIVPTLQSVGVICDLCDRTVKPSNGVWTCRCGTDTIFHATSYDVCADCFGQHVCKLPKPNTENAAPEEDEDAIAEGE